MRRIKLLPVAALLAPLLIVVLSFVPASAQQQTGSIHGHATNTVGLAITDGIVSLSEPGQTTAKYTFNTDANGDYKGSGIAAGTYSVTLRGPGMPPDKMLDQALEVKITAGQDVAQDFDLSRPDYIAKLPEDQRKQIEETRKKNAAAMGENAVIKNLNANLAKARADDKTGNFAESDSLMTQATQAKPNEPVLWFELGVAQNGEKKYDDAVTSLKKAIDLNAAAKKPDLGLAGGAYNELGSALTSLNKVDDAKAAYEAAAKADPTHAGMYYQNEAIIMTRVGKSDDAAAAADKAIAADPTRPIPYYLKGQALVGKATVDPKTQKILAPPGCIEAYEKYLELAPDGQFAAEVKAVLEGMGQTIKSSYKAKK
ncbi:MAG TPA: carboxypeptidase-like regulatory domain-containing protein [Silvibacterium sp.]|nr:carboxypeptidase-like regulatory domain-containing protein [Silvibacterium sp.]